MEINVDMLKDYIDKHGNLHRDFGPFSKMYLMSTENIREFLERLDLKDKNILSVAGSGDQMLNAYLMGASNVTLFDINPLAFAQAKLKKTAVMSLEYEEFCEFFFPELGNLFSHYLYEKVAYNLDKETKEIFRYIFKDFERKIAFINFYYSFVPKLAKQQSLNAYLDKDSYNRLHNIIADKEITFINTDIKNLREKLGNRLFDYIMLSNISDSIDEMYDKNALKQYKRLIHSLSKNLAKNGLMQVGYIYSFYGDLNNPMPSFAIDQEREKIFTPDEFKMQKVTGFRFNSDQDKIITYEHKKRKVS